MKMYSYRHGFVNVEKVSHCNITTHVDIDGKIQCFHNYRQVITDKHPSIISLEEAEERGFIRRKNGTARVKYLHIKANKLFITRDKVGSREAFYQLQKDFSILSDLAINVTDPVRFNSFVDDNLNEIDHLPFEWVEVSQ